MVLEALIVCAAGLLFAKGTHGRLWLALTLAALLASGIVVWSWASAHGDVLSLFSPMFYTSNCPAIAIAGLAQLLRGIACASAGASESGLTCPAGPGAFPATPPRCARQGATDPSGTPRGDARRQERRQR